MFVDISGLDREAVLVALWQRASNAMPFMVQAMTGELTLEAAREALQNPAYARDDGSLHFDYFKGAEMKVTFMKEGRIFAHLYDRAHGQGAAEEVVAGLRQEKEKENEKKKQ